MSWNIFNHGRFSCRTARLLSISIAVLLLPVLLNTRFSKESPVENKEENLILTEKKDFPETQKKVQLESDTKCKKDVPEWDNHSVVVARFPTVKEKPLISVYSSGDRVSKSINDTGSWDQRKTTMIIYRLKKLSDDAIFLDIGANIGWFTMAAAYAGFRVIAVEPFEMNIAHIRHSLCLAPAEVRARVTIVQCGLGEKDGDICELWQDPKVNHGDTHTVCDKVPRVWNHNPAYKFRKLGEVHLFQLDSLISNKNITLNKDDKVIVKIDTEGYEPFAFLGAKRFLTEIHPSLIVSEYGPAMMQASAKALNWSEDKIQTLPSNYLEFMRGFGYSFKNPNTREKIQDILFESNRTAK